MSIVELLKESGVDVEHQFVPFSRSRKKYNNQRSLNWTVRLKYGGRNEQTISVHEYTEGYGHTPAHKEYRKLGRSDSSVQDRKAFNKAIERETELGCRVVISYGEVYTLPVAIKLNLEDALACIIGDMGSIFLYKNYEEWAENIGFPKDSIKWLKEYEKIKSDAVALISFIGLPRFHEIYEAAGE